jgi:hypothetical protein
VLGGTAAASWPYSNTRYSLASQLATEARLVAQAGEGVEEGPPFAASVAHVVAGDHRNADGLGQVHRAPRRDLARAARVTRDVDPEAARVEDRKRASPFSQRAWPAVSRRERLR